MYHLSRPDRGFVPGGMPAVMPLACLYIGCFTGGCVGDGSTPRTGECSVRLL